MAGPPKKKQTYLNNPNLPTSGAVFEYTPKMVKEIKKCGQNILHFAEEYFFIVHPDKGRMKIPLRPYQKRVLRKMRDNRFFILLSPRQSGKSTMYTIYSLWHACFEADKRVVIVANKEATAIEIFKRIRLAYEELPNWLKPGVEEYGKTSMKLANGSEIGISTTTGSAARGMSISLLFIDELAFIEPGLMEDFWKSVYPTISSAEKAKIFIASTPNGTGNLFHKLWMGATKGDNGFGYDEIKWDEPPKRDEAFKKKTIENLGSYESWLQEYECIFLQHGDGAIDHEYFDKLLRSVKQPIGIYEDGAYRMFEEPKNDRIYIAGIDTAEGIGKDYSVINIYDITDLSNIEQVALYTSNRISPYDFTTKSYEILTQWGKPLALVERNGVGAQVADNLRNRFFYEKLVNWGGQLANRKQQNGMISHSNTKGKAVTNMRYWVSELKCVKFNDVETIKEFRDFTRYPNGSWAAKDGCNDDKVMSTVWALMALYDDIVQQYFEIAETDDNNKPKKLVMSDLGMNLVVDSKSLYADNEIFKQDIFTLPCVFGIGDQLGSDINTLEQQGWFIYE
jgi:hypothetical protein